MSPTRRMWIDTDTASDDVVAIVMALKHPNTEVVGMSIVIGNVPVELGVIDGLGVPVLEAVSVALGVPVELGVPVGLRVPVEDGDPVPEGVRESDGVCDTLRVCVCELLCVELGVRVSV